MSLQAILEAIVRHVETGGTIYGSSPLVSMAKSCLETGIIDGHFAETPAPASTAVQVTEPAEPRVAVSLTARHAMSSADLERRRATLGSSEIAAVCGLNPWASAHNVWMSKVYGDTFEGNEQTELGNILEPTILAIYCDRYDATMVKGVYQIGPEPWMSATPDGRMLSLRGEPVAGVLPVCEAKLVGLRSLFMWGPGNTDEEESDAVPLHYLIQALWQIACTGAPFVDVSALLGTEFRTYRVRANPTLQDKLVARGREFWHRYVLPKVPPPIDASDGAREMIKRLYPRSGAERIEGDPELESMVSKLRTAREELERATEQKQLIENLIKAQLKEASGAFGDGWNIRYATQKDGKRPLVFTDKAASKKAA